MLDKSFPKRVCIESLYIIINKEKKKNRITNICS